MYKLFIALFITSIISLNILPSALANTHKPLSPINVTFLVPAEKNNPFWVLVENNMKTAAIQFGINLNIIHIKGYANINRFYHYELTKQLLEDSSEVDYFITTLHAGKTKALLSHIESRQVKFISIINDVLPKQLSVVGKPREKFQHWIGQVVSDDKHAGLFLAQSLMDKARQRNNIGLGAVAISGIRENTAVDMRSLGLHEAFSSSNDFIFKQQVYSEWKFDLVIKQTQGLVKRHKNLAIIWCANDDLIAGNVIKTLKELGKKPNKDVLVGGMDWSKKGISLFKSGQLTSTIGGHFLDGGIAMALLYDYHHGFDFYDQYQGSVKQKMIDIDGHVEQVESLVNNNKWGLLDFTVYSRAMNPQQIEWNYSYNRVLKTLPQK